MNKIQALNEALKTQLEICKMFLKDALREVDTLKSKLNVCENQTRQAKNQISEKNNPISYRKSEIISRADKTDEIKISPKYQNISNADQIKQLEEKLSKNEAACQEKTKPLITQIQMNDSQISNLISQNVSNAERIKQLEEKVSENKAACQEETKKLRTQIRMKDSEISKLASENTSNADKANALEDKIDKLSRGTSCIGKSTGVHKIKVMNSFLVYCYSFPSLSGWTVIQRRENGTENFNRTWDEYRMGFGDFNEEFFIGLQKLHLLTSSQQHELIIYLKDSTGYVYAQYDNFQIAGEEEDFKIKSHGKYSGNAGDILRNSFNARFSTPDHDESIFKCAAQNSCGWWFNFCDSTINDVYQKDGIHWKGRRFMSTQMLIKPKYQTKPNKNQKKKH